MKVHGYRCLRCGRIAWSIVPPLVPIVVWWHDLQGCKRSEGASSRQQARRGEGE
jgi:hypothetical protein